MYTYSHIVCTITQIQKHMYAYKHLCIYCAKIGVINWMCVVCGQTLKAGWLPCWFSKARAVWAMVFVIILPEGVGCAGLPICYLRPAFPLFSTFLFWEALMTTESFRELFSSHIVNVFIWGREIRLCFATLTVPHLLLSTLRVKGIFNNIQSNANAISFSYLLTSIEQKNKLQ